MDEGREDWLLWGECRLFGGCMVAGRKKETYGELLSIWQEQGFVVREKPEMCKQYFPGQLMKTYFLPWCRIQVCRPHSLHPPQEKTTTLLSYHVSHHFARILVNPWHSHSRIHWNLIRALVQTVHMQALINTGRCKDFTQVSIPKWSIKSRYTTYYFSLRADASNLR